MKKLENVYRDKRFLKEEQVQYAETIDNLVSQAKDHAKDKNDYKKF
jgi:hypothetical protein